MITMGIIFGILSQKLHRKKGYEGGFAIGFFFGIIALIYSAGLPDKAPRKITKDENGEYIVTRLPIDETDEESYTPDNNILQSNEKLTICPECGYQIFEDEDECSNCGYKKP